MKRILSVFLAFGMLLSLAACASGSPAPGKSGSDVVATLLTPEVPSPEPDKTYTPPATLTQQQTAVAWQLFAAAAEKAQGKNVLVSPLSIQLALLMTAGGAKGKTLEEMQAVFCKDASLEAVNAYYRNYLAGLDSKFYTLHIANSIWFRSDEYAITIEPAFLESCARNYNAQAYKAPFDSQTLSDVNNWVKENTHGMIPKILDKIEPENVMFLINALAFEAQWLEPYNEYQLQPGKFTCLNGETQEVTYMASRENTYLESDQVTGFKKPYMGGDYYFVGLLPKEGVDIYDYIATLTPQALEATLSVPVKGKVDVWLPKFATEYSLSLNKILQELGMPTAFDGALADFSGMGSSQMGNIYISQVLHKTFIQVGEAGTKAGAATVVVMDAECAAPIEPEIIHKVTLDRPFVYMIVDRNNQPLFIGVMTEISK